MVVRSFIGVRFGRMPNPKDDNRLGGAELPFAQPYAPKRLIMASPLPVSPNAGKVVVRGRLDDRTERPGYAAGARPRRSGIAKLRSLCSAYLRQHLKWRYGHEICTAH
jgi:hypothetical protein